MATPRSPTPPPASSLAAPPPAPIPSGPGTRARNPGWLPALQPSTSHATASAAASRRHGYAVKSCGVKKRASRARLLVRVPLRDITNLIDVISAVAGPEAPLGQEVSPAAATDFTKPDAVLPAEVRVRLPALQDGDAAGPAAKAARYSLRKGFR